MQISDIYWDSLSNPNKRWFIFSSPIRVDFFLHQRRDINNNPLLTDVTKPRRAPVLKRAHISNITNEEWVRLQIAAHTFTQATTAPADPALFDTEFNVQEEQVREIEEVVEEVEEDINTLHHDLQLRYSGCYLFYKDSVYVVSMFFIDRNKIMMELYSIVSGATSKKVIVKYSKDIQFTLPKLGYINQDTFSIFAERNYNIPQSFKYKRGFTDASCSFFSVSDRELRACNIDTNIGNPISTIKLVENIFRKEYPSYDEAFEQVISFRRLSCAFSSTLCIKLDSLYNKFTLLKNTWTIAEYDQQTNKWKMLTNTFNEELTKLNIPFEVL